jgi:hypothetical protein
MGAHRIMTLGMRQEPRNTVYKRAWISVGEGLPLRDCTVIDISDSGAKLALENIDEIPREFSLRLSRYGHQYYPCRIVWSKLNTIGVRFSSDNEAGAKQSDDGSLG